MNDNLFMNLLRPENTPIEQQSLRAGYPCPLLTRRTLGLRADAILAARRNAPRCVRYINQASALRRPPT